MKPSLARRMAARALGHLSMSVAELVRRDVRGALVHAKAAVAYAGVAISAKAALAAGASPAVLDRFDRDEMVNSCLSG